MAVAGLLQAELILIAEDACTECVLFDVCLLNVFLALLLDDEGRMCLVARTVGEGKKVEYEEYADHGGKRRRNESVPCRGNGIL